MPIIITHGHVRSGVDPEHTPSGIHQIRMLELPFIPSVVFVGTGKRFFEVCRALIEERRLAEQAHVIATPFCGVSDFLDTNQDKIWFASSIPPCPTSHYYGLANTPGFDAWQFVTAQPDDALFLAGPELMNALGVKDPEKGALYKIDGRSRTLELLLLPDTIEQD